MLILISVQIFIDPLHFDKNRYNEIFNKNDDKDWWKFQKKRIDKDQCKLNFRQESLQISNHCGASEKQFKVP